MRNLFVIENIPLVSYPNCGESYLTAETLHEIERIKLHRRAWAQERPVAVAALRNWLSWQQSVATVRHHGRPVSFGRLVLVGRVGAAVIYVAR